MAVLNVALSWTRRSGPSVHCRCTVVSCVTLVGNFASVSLCFLICNMEGCHSIFLAVGMDELIHTKSGPCGDNHPAFACMLPRQDLTFPILSLRPAPGLASTESRVNGSGQGSETGNALMVPCLPDFQAPAGRSLTHEPTLETHTPLSCSLFPLVLACSSYQASRFFSIWTASCFSIVSSRQSLTHPA